MGKQIFNGCCFCFDLRSGGQILGWLYLVCGVVGALGSLLIIGLITQIEDMDFYINENEVSKACKLNSRKFLDCLLRIEYSNETFNFRYDHCNGSYMCCMFN